MDQEITPDSSWQNSATSVSDDIEEIIRHSLPPRSTSALGSRPRLCAPIRRRVRMEEHRRGVTKTYQTFQISTTIDARRSMDGSDISSSSALTVVTSATSSCTDPWSASGFVEEEEDGTNWDQEDDMLLVPKLEPVEDELDVEDLTDSKASLAPEMPWTTDAPAPAKRPRGRPRKHPKITPGSMAKVTKGRSKTGCLTCRKRKKKCDETKPECKLI